ncbi:FG-GAP repeat protein [Sulfurovum sp. CS9]|uniref:FG-GAP repeat protein n=1 Tax=Sulfurovum sp. CS9 TaxID=3391146 RepID=UPI0039E76478
MHTFSKIRWLLGVLALSAMAAAQTPQVTSSGEPMPKGLWQAFSEARHAVEVNKDEKGGYAYKAYNPKSRYGIRYGEKGLKLKTGSWEFAMQLQAYGQEKNLQPVQKAKLSTKGNKATFDRGTLSEWYINDAKGLEQGFTLKQPKGYDDKKELVLSLGFSGDVNAKWKNEGQSIAFYKEKNHAFDYEKLKAFDATGKTLPARLALLDKTLQIRVDAKGAQWPVTVDPIFATETKIIGVTSDAAAFDYFGYSVALSGDTAVVGAYGGGVSGSAYVMVETAAGWVTQAKLIPSDATSGKYFGHSVSLSGDTALVGAYGDDDNGTDSGSAYVFTRTATYWNQQAKLTASDAAANDEFGYSVALSGDTAVVGAHNKDKGPEAEESGAAYVFTRSGTVWSPLGKLTASDAAGGDYFGYSVALSGDTAVVGAYGDDDNGTDSGSAYVFEKPDPEWGNMTETIKLTASDAAAGNQFGWSVSLSGDTAVVGARYDDDGGAFSGSVYVFFRSGTIWSQQAKLTATLPAPGDQFGGSVAILSDTALIGATGNDDGGSAYVFTRSGTAWSQQAKLSASDVARDDSFGYSVALSGDTAVVGAYGNADAGSLSGSAYVFEKPGTSWIDMNETAKLTATLPTAGDNFGYSVSLSGDTAVVGADSNDNSPDLDNGAAYVFTHSGTVWSQQAKLTASDTAAGDQFGHSVSLSGDTAVVGADSKDNSPDQDNGAAYVFTRSGTVWSQQAKLTASDTAGGAYFGCSVAFLGDTALIGAYGDNEARGSTYVFTRSGAAWSQQAKLTASDAALSDNFGWSVALSGDTAVVGANYDDHDPEQNNGSAYVFFRSGTVWDQQAKLTASDTAALDQFGYSVSLSGDTAVVGARMDDDGGNNSGSAYVFTRSGIVWSQQAKLTPSDVLGGQFGCSVSLSGDTAVVGARYNNDMGSAYVFTRSGIVWSQQAKLTASDAGDYDQFGYSVALSGDTAVVGASYDDDGGSASGSAYLNRFECGFAGPIIADRWTMIGLPCDTGTTDTVEEIFGDTLDPNDYYYRWVVFERNEAGGYYARLDLSSVMSHGRGYWIMSIDNSYWDTTGTLTQFPVITGCSDPEGCFEYTLETPASAEEEFKYNLVGFPANTERIWGGVRFTVDGSSYSPSRAEQERYVSKTIWKWNGNGYDAYDDTTPGMQGNLHSHEGFWVKVLGGATGSIVKILIPANSVLSSPPPPPGT